MQPLLGGVVDDVEQFMGQAEALAGLGLQPIEGDDPTAVVPLGQTGCRYGELAGDGKARQAGDCRFGQLGRRDVEQFAEAIGLQLG
jgi:hypothetical protein